jgi:hypothetical protein
MVPSSFPLGEIIRNCDANGRIIKWLLELGEFDIEFCPRQAIKSLILKICVRMDKNPDAPYQGAA